MALTRLPKQNVAVKRKMPVFLQWWNA